jgi:hypothetical protein
MKQGLKKKGKITRENQSTSAKGNLLLRHGITEKAKTNKTL